jgi:CheY-like chemotaxis protein
MTLNNQRGLQARNGSIRSERIQIDFFSPTQQCDQDPSGRTVLFVDDEPSILTVRRMVFEAYGYTVLTAESGREALALMEANFVDIVVLDYMMPEMDGEETALRMRNRRDDLPIILSTGCAAVPTRVMEIVTMMVHKGSDPQILLDAVARQVGAPPQASQTAGTSLRPGLD